MLISKPNEEEEEEEVYYHCPFCDKPKQNTDHIYECSGYGHNSSRGMPPNQTGHEYGCGCADCMHEYQSLK